MSLFGSEFLRLCVANSGLSICGYHLAVTSPSTCQGPPAAAAASANLPNPRNLFRLGWALLATLQKMQKWIWGNGQIIVGMADMADDGFVHKYSMLQSCYNMQTNVNEPHWPGFNLETSINLWLEGVLREVLEFDWSLKDPQSLFNSMDLGCRIDAKKCTNTDNSYKQLYDSSICD